MIIETERLILREYTLEDFEALFEIMSDPETMQHYPKPFDEERTKGCIEWNHSTAIANGMKKVKEYEDEKNKISYAYAITREE